MASFTKDYEYDTPGIGGIINSATGRNLVNYQINENMSELRNAPSKWDITGTNTNYGAYLTGARIIHTAEISHPDGFSTNYCDINRYVSDTNSIYFKNSDCMDTGIVTKSYYIEGSNYFTLQSIFAAKPESIVNERYLRYVLTNGETEAIDNLTDLGLSGDFPGGVVDAGDIEYPNFATYNKYGPADFESAKRNNFAVVIQGSGSGGGKVYGGTAGGLITTVLRKYNFKKIFFYVGNSGHGITQEELDSNKSFGGDSEDTGIGEIDSDTNEKKYNGIYVKGALGGGHAQYDAENDPGTRYWSYTFDITSNAFQYNTSYGWSITYATGYDTTSEKLAYIETDNGESLVGNQFKTYAYEGVFGAKNSTTANTTTTLDMITPAIEDQPNALFNLFGNSGGNRTAFILRHLHTTWWNARTHSGTYHSISSPISASGYTGAGGTSGFSYNGRGGDSALVFSSGFNNYTVANATDGARGFVAVLY